VKTTRFIWVKTASYWLLRFIGSKLNGVPPKKWTQN
jgi:hypothetical protein